MITTKFYLDTRSGTTPYPLKLRLTYQRQTAYLAMGIQLMPEQWNGIQVVKHPRAAMMNNQLIARKAEIDCLIYDWQREGKLNGRKVAEIKNMLECAERGEEPGEMTVEEHYNKFLETKKGRTKEIYRDTLKKMLAYGMPRTYNDLTVDWLRGFDGWLDMSVNARAIHLRNIRALVNDAIDNELTTSYPFRKFKIKREETRKRALSLEQVHTLRDWPVEEYQKGYRDIFILMMLMRGINIGDLALLKEENIVDGRINYRRQKTHELYSIKVEPEVMEIINRYRGKEYLLDICDRYANYGDYMRRMNKGLRKIGELKMKGCKKIIKPLFPDITTYWARHSYATIGIYDCGLSMDMVADLLGHQHELKVTSVYVKKNEKAMDAAARKVIDKILYDK